MMIKVLDRGIISNVVTLAEKLAKKISLKKQDTADLVNEYKPSNLFSIEDITLTLPEEEDRLFANAMVMLKDIYPSIYSDHLHNDYAVIGARHLLMPEREFTSKCRECDDDLYVLKIHYPYVSYNMLAQHLADVDMCFVCQRTDRRCHSFHKNQRVSVKIVDFPLLNKIADATLKTSDGIYTENIPDGIRINAWRIDTNRVQIICWGNEL